MPKPPLLYPSLYQINTRCYLRELGVDKKLDDITDKFLKQQKDRGFDWLWFLGVWQTGAAGREVSLTNADWRREYELVLPDLSDKDITGSPFAVKAYTVHRAFGG